MHSHLQNKKKIKNRSKWNDKRHAFDIPSHLYNFDDLSLFFAQNPTFSSILSLYIILNGWDVCRGVGIEGLE